MCGRVLCGATDVKGGIDRELAGAFLSKPRDLFVALSSRFGCIAVLNFEWAGSAPRGMPSAFEVDRPVCAAAGIESDVKLLPHAAPPSHAFFSWLWSTPALEN